MVGMGVFVGSTMLTAGLATTTIASSAGCLWAGLMAVGCKIGRIGTIETTGGVDDFGITAGISGIEALGMGDEAGMVSSAAATGVGAVMLGNVGDAPKKAGLFWPGMVFDFFF